MNRIFNRNIAFSKSNHQYSKSLALDIDCNKGYSTELLSILNNDKNFEYIGIDDNLENIEYAKKIFPIHQFLLNDINIIDNKKIIEPIFQIIQINQRSFDLWNNIDIISKIIKKDGNLWIYNEKNTKFNYFPKELNEYFSIDKIYLPNKIIKYSIWKKI